ncbi:TetR/AcrR family transcriptional regulator [Glycomyces buryatensis]|uniref:TetR/AcrR family transcriptional regulator n=1 Tax=Glycomyces buryatensis TaxID=2570927 RepID=A0A4S8QD00_9ACTN|nr:TetR/AcrR family transcriptional regulator [Glycomyces buryatensis]THV42180.1 TetR/AcrR family transcriptional regulator [Glycomyces buryatensis]
MAETNPALDRRAALKAKSRQAILDAAADLMRRRSSADFSVDELAAAADVSRRTVFNHFASLEDVVTAVAGQMLAEVVGGLGEQAANSGRRGGTILQDLADTASGSHLVPTIVHLTEIFQVEDDDRHSTREAVLMQRAFALFNQQMSAVMSQRHPEIDARRVEMLVAAFCGGILAQFDHWIAETGGVDTPESRRAWDDLISALVSLLRDPSA